MPTRSAADAVSGADVPNSVLSKAFTILSMFDGMTETIRLTTLSRLTGIPKPTVYRLAQELVELGLLERSGSSYQLGRSLYALGQRVSASSLLHTAARPVIVDLCAATRATVHLAVLDGSNIYYVERLGGVRGVHYAHARAGSRVPAERTASGRLLLAMCPHDETAVRGRRAGPSPRKSQLMMRELDQIRNKRLAVERGMVLPDYKTFAVPITDPDGSTVASLSATVTTDYQPEDCLISHLRSASTAIGRRLTTLGMTHQLFPDPPARPRVQV